MSIPQVTCGADAVVAYNPANQLVALSAVATNAPILAWQWTILSVPTGSTANVGVKGDFTDGVATIQNPQLLIDGAVAGGYTLQCVATNATGASDPNADMANAQQAIIMRTSSLALYYPGDYLYDWGKKYLVPTLALLESSAVDAIHKGVSSEISSIALKSVPVSADLLVIEDSAAASAKKRVTVETLRFVEYKLPIIAWNAAGALDVYAPLGQSSTVWIVLQDGKPRYFIGTLAWNFVNGVADLGLDAGVEAPSTWYYIYAVPKAIDDAQLSLRASVNVPPVGPVGYTKFKYLGAFRNSAGSNIIPTVQIGANFHYREQQLFYSAAPAFADVANVEISLVNYVPDTAAGFFMRSHGVDSSAGASQWSVNWRVSAASTASVFWINLQYAAGGLSSNSEGSYVPFITGTKSVWRRILLLAGAAPSIIYTEADVIYWTDGYLT